MGKYFLYFFNVLIFRVFDQYEINIEITKHRHSYLATASDSPPEVDYQEFGLWDAIYNLGLTTSRQTDCCTPIGWDPSKYSALIGWDQHSCAIYVEIVEGKK